MPEPNGQGNTTQLAFFFFSNTAGTSKYSDLVWFLIVFKHSLGWVWICFAFSGGDAKILHLIGFGAAFSLIF